MRLCQWQKELVAISDIQVNGTQCENRSDSVWIMANMLLRTELCASTHAKSSLTVEDAELDIKCIANN